MGNYCKRNQIPFISYIMNNFVYLFKINKHKKGNLSVQTTDGVV